MGKRPFEIESIVHKQNTCVAIVTILSPSLTTKKSWVNTHKTTPVCLYPSAFLSLHTLQTLSPLTPLNHPYHTEYFFSFAFRKTLPPLRVSIPSRVSTITLVVSSLQPLSERLLASFLHAPSPSWPPLNRFLFLQGIIQTTSIHLQLMPLPQTIVLQWRMMNPPLKRFVRIYFITTLTTSSRIWTRLHRDCSPFTF